jgi:hypothetical protein
MNDIQTVDPNLCISAVVFCEMNKRNMEIEIKGDKPYFYLNTIGAIEGEYVIVGSTGWNVVLVLRNVKPDHVEALSKVTACLLGKVQYDANLVKDANKRLLEFQARTSVQRLQKMVDKELEGDLEEIKEVLKKELLSRSRGRAKSTPIDFSDIDALD